VIVYDRTLCTCSKLGRQLLSNRNSVLQGPTFTCMSICDEFKCVQVFFVISYISTIHYNIRNCVKTDKFIICASALMSHKWFTQVSCTVYLCLLYIGTTRGMDNPQKLENIYSPLIITLIFRLCRNVYSNWIKTVFSFLVWL